jgi:glucokinase
MTLAAGVDVGGTKIAACIADISTGRVMAYERVPTGAERGGQAVLTTAASLLKNLSRGTKLGSIGIGLCELVDLNGQVTSAYTVDWRDLDVEAEFREIAPVRLESDVRAAAVAEARFGRTRGVKSPWIYLSVGTGISYCLMVGEDPYTGANGNALLVGAPMVEEVSSGLALQRAAGGLSAEEVLGDGRWASLVSKAATGLGLVMAVLVNALDPALVVVGGGLGLAAAYREVAEEVMRGAVELEPSRRMPVVTAELSDVGGALGAALIGARREVSGRNRE